MERPGDKSQESTRMLQAWGGGDRGALESLLPLVYDELHRQAARYMRRERPNHTLRTSALINEAYLRLVDQREANWQNRAHFFAIAAQAMRRILVNHARARRRQKRGGPRENLPLEEAARVAPEDGGVDQLALDEALTRLAGFDEQQARVRRTALLQRPEHRGDRLGTRHLPRHRQARVEHGEGLAAARTDDVTAPESEGRGPQD